MKHPSTRAVYDYWNEKRAGRAAPDRSDIDPGAIRHALGDTFMLATDFLDQLRLRLAGTRVCALFCREIKGEIFADVWDDKSRDKIKAVLSVLDSETQGIVAGVTARTEDGSEAMLEMLLLPLTNARHGRVRAMGILAPIVPPYWLGERPVVELELGTLRHLGDDLDKFGDPRFATMPAGGRVRRGLVVYSGGREASSGG